MYSRKISVTFSGVKFGIGCIIDQHGRSLMAPSDAIGLQQTELPVGGGFTQIQSSGYPQWLTESHSCLSWHMKWFYRS